MQANDFLFTQYEYDPENEEVVTQEISVRDVLKSEALYCQGLKFIHDEGWFRYNITVKDGIMYLLKHNYDFIKNSLTCKEVGVIEDGPEVFREIRREAERQFDEAMGY